MIMVMTIMNTILDMMTKVIEYILFIKVCILLLIFAIVIFIFHLISEHFRKKVNKTEYSIYKYILINNLFVIGACATMVIIIHLLGLK